MNGFIFIIRRDLKLAIHQRLDNLMVVIFFILAVVLFPLGVGPDLDILSRIAYGVIWVSALLASMLSLERLFQSDYEDGTLELLCLMPTSLELVVLAKILAHWLTTGLPLIVAVPFLSFLMNMGLEGLPMLVLALLLGTPSLSLIGAVGASLVLGSRRGGTLLALLIIPLYVPVLIFGVSAVDSAIVGLDVKAQLLILCAFLLVSFPLCLWAATVGLRQAIE